MDLRGFGLNDDDLAALGYKVHSKSASGAEPSAGRPSTARPMPGGPIDPSWRLWAATLLLLVITVWGASPQRWIPRAVAANHPDTAFSSARAMAQLAEIARLPRPMGSPEHDRVRALLAGRLEELGLETHVQTATVVTREGGVARAATVRNVVARLAGSAPTGALLLTAHYDGPALSPAAGSGGAGLVTVLETVRAVTMGPPLRNDLLVVLADGHEPGLLGARAFVEQHPWMDEVALAVSVDSWGVSGPSLRLAAVPLEERFARVLAEQVPAAAPVPMPPRLLGQAVLVPDVEPFRDGGTPALSLTSIGGRALHARPDDVAGAVRERTLQHHGVQLLAMTRALGAGDLGRASSLEAGPSVQVRLPGVGVVHYPAGWSLPVSLALLVGWGVAALALRQRRSGTRRGLAWGVGVGALAVVVAWLGAGGVFGRLEPLHPEYGMLGSAFYEEGLHLLGLVCLVGAIVTAAYPLARLRFGAAELYVGALVVPLAAVFLVTVLEPPAAAQLQWALAPALPAALLLAASGRARRPGLWEWVVYAVLAVASLSMLVPFVETAAAALTLRSAGLLAAMVAAGSLLLLPVGEWLLRPRAWVAPAVLAGLALVSFTAALPTLRGGAGHPTPTTLVYLVEQPAADNLPVGPASDGPLGGPVQAARYRAASGPAAAEPPAAPPVGFAVATASADAGSYRGFDAARPRRLIGSWLTVRGPGEPWARSWVAQPSPGATAAGVLLMAREESYEVAGSGPASDVSPPRVGVARDVVEGGRRRLELLVLGGLGGEMLGIHLAEGGHAVIAGVGDARLPESSLDAAEDDGPADAEAGPVRSLLHWGEPVGPVLPVVVQVDPEQRQLELHIVEHHLRPAEVLGPGFYERADSIAPDPSTGSDRVIQRTRVVLPLGVAGGGVTRP